MGYFTNKEAFGRIPENSISMIKTINWRTLVVQDLATGAQEELTEKQFRAAFEYVDDIVGPHRTSY